MGLLSDPEYGSAQWVRVLRKIHGLLSVLFYIGAIVWFVMLGNKTFNNETYFSENALLPGLVTNEFNGEPAAKQFFNEFNEELKDKYEDTDVMPVPWLVAKMSQLHLEVYTHNFTLNYPLGEGRVYTGTNVYGILRAPRTSSLEALVVSAPYRPPSSHQKSTAAGIALMLAFAQFARPQKYWAKDIIFLVTEHEQLGMQAWLEAYHGIQSDAETFYTSLGSFWKPNPFLDLSTFGTLTKADHEKCLNPGRLKGRSGSIQAAINLEFDVPKIKYVEVKIEGLNGQLPNLDLVNLVHKLCVKSGVHHSYKNSYSWVRSRNKYDEWWNSVSTMLGMVTTQLAGVPNGNHGLFHRFGIEAVTLEGRGPGDPAGDPPQVNALTSANFYRLGAALETVLRSLNNLLERFHQSYFFYLLPQTGRFVSIGQYMPSLCLISAAMLIKSLALWVSLQKEDKTNKKEKSKKDDKAKVSGDDSSTEVEEKETKEKSAVSKVPGAKKTKGDAQRKKSEETLSVVNVGLNYFLVHLLGYAVMNSPLLFSQIGSKYYNLPSEVSVYYGLAITSAVLTLLSPFMMRVLRSGPMHYEEVALVNILVLIELATICLSVGMHNFSLGFVMATLLAPVALVSGVNVRGGGKIRSILVQFKRLLCIISHPLCLVTLGMIIYSKMLFPEESNMHVIGRGRDAAMQAIMYSVVDSLIYGNWLFNVATSLVLPTWIIFWQINCSSVDK
ncbi:glycosylphosphatidylinositol anchor attachment 1 protein isoform X2 [Plutella xylostella]|uniref:glycosylphosphatidylinositol anchor attachment 1 protein isoform X1 n=1 Tax=Plutella xylostella TaxID=51655 RepID=UPI00203249BF|nr:glycosylphosphatidylinositol anchor attachment 1 protein isoform X1 [Plutella xylostella]XP_048484150.1 glycosylphosphatidylinositol anchor attachment 1 protein isoform X2 [Plutella xylostella]